ncbi:MAG TPA: hypothetical protein VJV75_00615 [Candidatus Polarisedimenticolia bacterium]|nr:hypothetical protein [Candidatus Polarisedimenticolia bacterium]
MSRSRRPALFLACAVLLLPEARVDAASVAVARPGAGTPDAALARMVETERAFAALGLEKGVRESFLVYIADDGIGFDNGPIPLKESMRARPAGPEPYRLIWEPRYGDVAASGEVGYLTGPYRVESRGSDGAPVVRHGLFFSVWSKQADGEYRNVLDIGVRLKEAAEFAPGFRRAPHADRHAGGTREEARSSLIAAERALNEAARIGTLEAALVGALDPDARLHREGVAPAVGMAAARRLLAGAGRLAEAESRFAGPSESGEFGWSYGRYGYAEAAGAAPATAAPEHGSYARVWTRDRKGAWRVVADIASPDREAR